MHTEDSKEVPEEGDDQTETEKPEPRAAIQPPSWLGVAFLDHLFLG